MNAMQLPPERDLPHAQAMLDNILGDVAPSRDEAPAGRPWLRLAVAATAVLTVGGLVTALVLNDRQQAVPADPAPTSTAPVTPSPSPTSVPVSEDGINLEVVEIRQAQMVAESNPPQISHLLLIHLRVSSPDGEDLGAYRASVTDVDGRPGEPWTGSWPEVTLAPVEGTAGRELDAAFSFLTYEAVPERVELFFPDRGAGATVELAEHQAFPEPGPESPDATQTQHPTEEPPQPPQSAEPVIAHAIVGDSVGTSYFDVSVLEKQASDVATGYQVEVCYARAHPDANADGTTRTSTDPWRVGVYDGETQTPPDVAYLPVSEFPVTDEFGVPYEERLLRVGECNSGWIAMEHHNPDLAWLTLRYAPQDFGDEVTWANVPAPQLEAELEGIEYETVSEDEVSVAVSVRVVRTGEIQVQSAELDTQRSTHGVSNADGTPLTAMEGDESIETFTFPTSPGETPERLILYTSDGGVVSIALDE